jgi:hypothetical protein
MEEPIYAGCTVQVLPQDRVIEAARVAVNEDPRNAPPIAQFATIAGNRDADRLLNPLYIAAMTTKYFGPKPLVLPVYFMDNPDEATRRIILQYANIWSDNGCGISYQETRNQGDSRVRIGRGRRGHFSYLGTDIYLIGVNDITMNLQGFTSQTDPRELMRVIPHEFGHNQGCPHEHAHAAIIARLKKEAVIRETMAQQGWSRQQVEAQVFTPLEQASIMGTKPDDTSIMCYRFEAHLTIDNVPIFGGMAPNANDFDFMRTIYPKAGGGEPLPKPEPPKPVEPPAPKPKPIAGLPRLTYRRWSGLMRYSPSRGPVKFVFTAPKQDAYAIQIQGEGNWIAQATEIKDGAAPVIAKKIGQTDTFLAAFEEGNYILSVRPRAAQRAASFRVRLT